MDDLISRQAAIEAIRLYEDDEDINLDEVIATVAHLPSAQPEPCDDASAVARHIATIIANEQDMRVILENARQEIIYCKDCKHYNAGFECLIEGYGIERDENWYCGDAERREDE